MTKYEEFNARRRNIEKHIRALEQRHSEPKRREAVRLLKERLARIPKN